MAEQAHSAEIDALRAEVEHWKAHAEEAGRGFTQVCKDYARVSARNAALVQGIEEWAVNHFGYLPIAIDELLGRVTPPEVTPPTTPHADDRNEAEERSDHGR